MSDTAKSTEKPHELIAKLLREHFLYRFPVLSGYRLGDADRIEKQSMPGRIFYQGKWISPGDLPPPPTVQDEWSMACPKCGKDDEIDVLASLYVRLTPDSTDADASHDGEHAWSPASAAKCCACGHSGIVREFTTESAAQAAVRVAVGLSVSHGGFTRSNITDAKIFPGA